MKYMLCHMVWYGMVWYQFGQGQSSSKYKKGDFVAQRHDSIKGLFVSRLDKDCKGVKLQPHFPPLDSKRFKLKTTNTSEEARLDIKAQGFWRRGQNAFFDIRVTHVNCTSSKGQSTADISKTMKMRRSANF